MKLSTAAASSTAATDDATEEDEEPTSWPESEFRFYYAEWGAFVTLYGDDYMPDPDSNMVIFSSTEARLSRWIKLVNSDPKRLSCVQRRMLEKLSFPLKLSNGQRWETQYTLLQNFFNINNHSDVARRDGALGGWVATQRSAYKDFNNGKPSPMTHAKIEKLERLRFKWSIIDDPESEWRKRFNELKAYYETHNHSNVRSTDENKRLANWVKTQRAQHKKNKLPDEKVSQLQRLAFEWAPRDRKSS
ncbi:hypothetical protein THAOC_08677 [Thalassiosira oceanica]|uniref:Helicase-associated domain-containing protein n=1 Tax=Thalassiosira oceanica TaxID=159749 RepID=K0SYE1_THAOC|nr:hypothetical protein THAOC_08677 [Thalassiosira oceanica]|mmetsp:Transcript_32795/g.78338  ORF Transcript_32795/g.78338 Transcript_32795/m.78338 type:complete len:246 (+) Transcript_32795:193-930(+)|eukprot:EJK70004.1 hypothetical protein THAOC_08677 [Thalassiosira oceanica]